MKGGGFYLKSYSVLCSYNLQQSLFCHIIILSTFFNTTILGISDSVLLIPLSAAVTDVAGVVVDVGPGVNGFQAGDQVVAMLNSFVSTLNSWLCYFKYEGTNSITRGIFTCEMLITS